MPLVLKDLGLDSDNPEFLKLKNALSQTIVSSFKSPF